jgi:transcriptional regulator with XRE-family HTH domain
MAEHNLGRNELAERSGLGRTTLTRIMRHGHVPAPAQLRRLAAFFGADPDTVMEIAGVVRLSDLPAELPPDVRDLARRLYRLDPADRDAILRQFDGILQLVEGRPRRPGAPPAAPRPPLAPQD